MLRLSLCKLFRQLFPEFPIPEHDKGLAEYHTQSKSHEFKVLFKMITAGCAHNVPKKRLYSIKELVVEIGATEWFWRSQIWGGKLSFVQVGRKMFIDSNDIENFIQKNKNSY